MEFPHEIELVVIATSSNMRRIVFEQLIDHAFVKYILFEKVLFQRKEDYYFVQEKLKESGSRLG